MFCSCLKSDVHSIMVNDAIFSYSLGLALSELEIIKSGNPKGKKKFGKGPAGYLIQGTCV